MEIEVERLADAGGGTGEGGHLADHGEDDGEGLVGGGCEGDMEDGGMVDY